MLKSGDIIERFIEYGRPNEGERLVYYVLDGTIVRKWDLDRVASLPILHPPHFFCTHAPSECNPDYATSCVKPIYPSIHGSRVITGQEAEHWRKVGESLLIRLRLEGRRLWADRE